MSEHWVHEPMPFLWQWTEHWGIRYYGLAYVLGFLAVYAGLKQFHRRGWSELHPDRRGDLLMWLVAGTLVGGRLGFCLLYDWPRTVAEPWSIIDVRSGGITGMASHGAFLGIILAVWGFARQARIPFWSLADDVATLAPVGIFLGRVANFLNGELWGRVSEVPWAVVFVRSGGGPLPRHPSQLYEAFGEGLLLFAVLLGVRSLHPLRGVVSLVFLGGYAVVRFVCEFFREPDPQIGYLALGWTQGQWLSLGLLALAGVLGVVLARDRAGR